MNKTTDNEPIWADEENNNVRRTRTNRWDASNAYAVTLANVLISKLQERYCTERHTVDVRSVEPWGFLDNGFEGVMVHAFGDSERGNFTFTLIRTTKATYDEWVKATCALDDILWQHPGISR